MIEILLHGLKMDPLVSLHYYAPVCALINLLVIPFTEGLAPFYELMNLGPLILLSNAAVAFFLNVAAVFLVGVGSGLVLTLAGVFKDILLITGSVLIFATMITPLQVIGEFCILLRRSFPSLIKSVYPLRTQVTPSHSAVSSFTRPQDQNRACHPSACLSVRCLQVPVPSTCILHLSYIARYATLRILHTYLSLALPVRVV